MNMSKAALPANYGHASEQDKLHPMFSAYCKYRSNMARLLVDSADFRDWLFHQEQNRTRDNAALHPEYENFLAWMRATKGGGRKCPAGAFPDNFFYWLGGGRW